MKFIVFLFIFFSQVYAIDFIPSECPVVGNIKSKIYHVPGGNSYGKMLKKNKKGDNRICFRTEKEASEAGYQKAKI